MATGYHELVIEGPAGWTLGFIQGFLQARGNSEHLLDAEAEGFDCAPLRERLREILHPSSRVAHLLVPDSVRELVLQAIGAAGQCGVGVKLLHTTPVEAARFEFSFRLYSRQHAERVRRLFEELPAGVELSADTDFTERVDPEARGVEAYAPAHHYELSAKGVVQGSVESVVVLYRAAVDEEAVKVGHLAMVYPEP